LSEGWLFTTLSFPEEYDFQYSNYLGAISDAKWVFQSRKEYNSDITLSILDVSDKENPKWLAFREFTQSCFGEYCRVEIRPDTIVFKYPYTAELLNEDLDTVDTIKVDTDTWLFSLSQDYSMAAYSGGGAGWDFTDSTIVVESLTDPAETVTFDAFIGIEYGNGRTQGSGLRNPQFVADDTKLLMAELVFEGINCFHIRDLAGQNDQIIPYGAAIKQTTEVIGDYFYIPYSEMGYTELYRFHLLASGNELAGELIYNGQDENWYVCDFNNNYLVLYNLEKSTYALYDLHTRAIKGFSLGNANADGRPFSIYLSQTDDMIISRIHADLDNTMVIIYKNPMD